MCVGTHDCTIGIVISREWIKGAQLHPAVAQRNGCITVKSANISAHHGDLIEV